MRDDPGRTMMVGQWFYRRVAGAGLSGYSDDLAAAAGGFHFCFDDLDAADGVIGGDDGGAFVFLHAVEEVAQLGGVAVFFAAIDWRRLSVLRQLKRLLARQIEVSRRVLEIDRVAHRKRIPIREAPAAFSADQRNVVVD